MLLFMKDELMFLGNKLRERRLEANRTQAETAAFLAITPQSYSEMERGVIKPSAVNLVKLCVYFNCPVETFFDVQPFVLSKI